MPAARKIKKTRPELGNHPLNGCIHVAPPISTVSPTVERLTSAASPTRPSEPVALVVTGGGTVLGKTAGCDWQAVRKSIPREDISAKYLIVAGFGWMRTYLAYLSAGNKLAISYWLNLI